MNKTLLPILTAALLAGISSTHAQSLLRITEAMSSSGSGGTPDWFEITNLGNQSQIITGWNMDDNSFASGSSVSLLGISSIAAGETVVFLETGGGADLTNFRNYWGGLSGIQVGYYSGSGVGFSSSGDGVVIFNGTNEINRVTFGSATGGVSFNFGYDSAGVLNTSSNALSSIGMYGVFTVNTTFGTGTTAVSNTGSPGVVPEPSSAALLGFGTLALLGLRRLNRKS